MRINELRIGNLVLFNDKVEPITGILKSGFYFGKNGFAINLLEWFQPIILTEEWLVKAGAKKIHDVLDIFELDRFELYPFYTNGFWKVVDKENKTYITKVSYVHELQNMYFVLNGEELQL